MKFNLFKQIALSVGILVLTVCLGIGLLPITFVLTLPLMKLRRHYSF